MNSTPYHLQSHEYQEATTDCCSAIGEELEREAQLLMQATTAAHPDLAVIQRHAKTLWRLVQEGQAARMQSIPMDSHAERYHHNPKQLPY